MVIGFCRWLPLSILDRNDTQILRRAKYEPLHKEEECLCVNDNVCPSLCFALDLDVYLLQPNQLLIACLQFLSEAHFIFRRFQCVWIKALAMISWNTELGKTTKAGWTAQCTVYIVHHHAPYLHKGFNDFVRADIHPPRKGGNPREVQHHTSGVQSVQ